MQKVALFCLRSGEAGKDRFQPFEMQELVSAKGFRRMAFGVLIPLCCTKIAPRGDTQCVQLV